MKTHVVALNRALAVSNNLVQQFAFAGIRPDWETGETVLIKDRDGKVATQVVVILCKQIKLHAMSDDDMRDQLGLFFTQRPMLTKMYAREWDNLHRSYMFADNPLVRVYDIKKQDSR